MSRGKRSQRGPLRLALLLTWASTSSALSLASFQIITSGTVPAPCIVAYNSVIPDCVTQDFTNGNRCSAACVSGLTSTATTVTAICGGLIVNPNSLLGLTLSGNLVGRLCPGNTVQTTKTVTQTVRTSSSTRAVTSVAPTRTTNVPSPTLVISTTSVPDVQTSIGDGQEDPTSDTSVAVVTTAPTTQLNAPSQTRSSSTTSRAQTTAQGAKVTGGGSPFDEIQSLAVTTRSSSIAEVLLAAIAAAAILLR